MDIKTVGICGSGIMGAGVAEVSARAGCEVVIRSRTQAAADACVATVDKGLKRQVERGKLGADEATSILGRLTPATDLHRLNHCDLVIESVVEDLVVKKELFAELDLVCPDQTILATNTSTLPVIEMAAATARPDRVIGVHFFNPAAVMSLVEIVPTLATSAGTADAAFAFAQACGKDPVRVADRAGFVVNRLLFPYLNNAIRALEDGTATMEDIDTAMKGGCGFPMGPFALLDLVGLDTSLSILEALYAEFGDPNYAPAPTLRRLVSAGRLGRKTKSGFHTY